MRRVFISHAAANRKESHELCALLEESGLPCWIAPRDIRPGQIYAEAIIDGIEGCGAMVFVLSEASNDSIHVRNEIERAVSKRKRIVPLRIEPVAPSKALELFVSSSHWIDASAGSLASQRDTLVASLAPLVGEAGDPPRPPARAVPAPRKARSGAWLVASGLALVLAAAGAGYWLKRNHAVRTDAVIPATPPPTTPSLRWDITFPPEENQHVRAGEGLRFMARVHASDQHPGVDYVWSINGREVARGGALDVPAAASPDGGPQRVDVAAVDGTERIQRSWRIYVTAPPTAAPAKPPEVAPRPVRKTVAAEPEPAPAPPPTVPRVVERAAPVTPPPVTLPPPEITYASPRDRYVTVPKGRTQRFSVRATAGSRRTRLRQEWSLNGTPTASRGDSSYTLPTTLGPGTYQLAVRAIDDDGRASPAHQWTVEVQPDKRAGGRAAPETGTTSVPGIGDVLGVILEGSKGSSQKRSRR